MKRILFVVNHFRYANGVAEVLRSLLDNLDSSKYEVSLLVLYKLDNKFAVSIMNKVHIIKGFGFYFRGFDKLVNLLPSSWLHRVLIHEDYDLEIAFQYGVPTKVVSTYRGNKLCWMHGYDDQMILKRYYQRFPAIINVSRNGMERMIRDGFPIDNCDYCYNIVDETRIMHLMQERSTIKKRKKYCVITVGRLSKEKAFMRFFKCINNLKKELHEFEFWIIGGGNEEKILKDYIMNNGLSNTIRMFGEQENPFQFMKKADLYFCGSYTEGFSTSCQEAAIMGLPVVSVNVSGAMELFEQAKCGCVIDNNSQSIEAIFYQLAHAPNQIEEWKRRASTAKSRFYKRERIKKIETVIDKYIK